MKQILLSLALAFGMQAYSQTIDTIISDTLLNIHYTGGTIDTASISRIDSLTFTYVNDTIWVGACNNLTSLTYNGYNYDLIEIGNQCWFKENLQTIRYSDGTPIDFPGTSKTAWNNNTTGAYAWYDDDSISYASTNGASYNWHAVNNSAGLCPSGWHVPSHSDWTALENSLEVNGYNYDGSFTGHKYAKAVADSISWTTSSSIAGTPGNTGYPAYRNKSGFSSRPTLYRNYDGDYYWTHHVAHYWTSTSYGSLYAKNFSVNAFEVYLVDDFSGTQNGIAVRCLKD